MLEARPRLQPRAVLRYIFPVHQMKRPPQN
jgi:hypothetical protein